MDLLALSLCLGMLCIGLGLTAFGYYIDYKENQ